MHFTLVLGLGVFQCLFTADEHTIQMGDADNVNLWQGAGVYLISPGYPGIYVAPNYNWILFHTSQDTRIKVSLINLYHTMGDLSHHNL